MNKVPNRQLIDRLKHSLAASNQEAWEEGKEAGIQWAEESAEAAELLRLAEKYSDFDLGYSDLPASDFLFGIIDPAAADDPTSANEFWEEVVGDAKPIEPSFVKGFAAGALEVWSSVKTEVLR